MDISHPTARLVREPHSTIVQVLARTNDGLTGRQISARVSEKSLATVQRALAELTKIGLLLTVEVPPAILYKLNRDHLLWRPVEGMLTAAARLDSQIDTLAVKSGVRGLSIVLFGSVARGESTELSDVDLALIYDSSSTAGQRDQLIADLYQSVQLWTGNRPQVVDISISDLRRMVDSHDPLVDSLIRDGRTVFGSALTLRIDKETAHRS